MRRLTKITTTALALVGIIMGVVGCSGPKAIPDKDLVNIFHDAFLANAYISESNITEDSLLLYEPILERYGYTVEDMQFTVRTIASRKSSRLSDLVSDASRILEEESKLFNYQLMVLDTIDNVAKRKYTHVVYRDTLIKANRLKDTTKLRITIGDIVPAEYTVEFNYHIDTTDENRNSRVEAYFVLNDDTEAVRHTLMLSRYRDGKYTRKFTADSSHKELYINMFYHPNNEEAKRPGIKILLVIVNGVLQFHRGRGGNVNAHRETCLQLCRGNGVAGTCTCLGAEVNTKRCGNRGKTLACKALTVGGGNCVLADGKGREV